MLMSVSVFVADAKQAVWSFDLEDYSHLGILNVRTYVCMRRCEKWWWRSVYTYVRTSCHGDNWSGEPTNHSTRVLHNQHMVGRGLAQRAYQIGSGAGKSAPVMWSAVACQLRPIMYTYVIIMYVCTYVCQW